MTMKAFRARFRAGLLYPEEELPFAEGTEIDLVARTPAANAPDLARVLADTAGAWSDEAHPDLRTRDDVTGLVRALRAGFERSHGG